MVLALTVVMAVLVVTHRQQEGVSSLLPTAVAGAINLTVMLRPLAVAGGELALLVPMGLLQLAVMAAILISKVQLKATL